MARGKGRPRKTGERFPGGKLKTVRVGEEPTTERRAKGYMHAVTIRHGEGKDGGEAEVWREALPLDGLNLTTDQRQAAEQLRLAASIPCPGEGLPAISGDGLADGPQATAAASRYAFAQRWMREALQAAGMVHSRLLCAVCIDCKPLALGLSEEQRDLGFREPWEECGYACETSARRAIRKSLDAITKTLDVWEAL